MSKPLIYSNLQKDSCYCNSTKGMIVQVTVSKYSLAYQSEHCALTQLSKDGKNANVWLITDRADCFTVLTLTSAESRYEDTCRAACTYKGSPANGNHYILSLGAYSVSSVTLFKNNVGTAGSGKTLKQISCFTFQTSGCVCFSFIRVHFVTVQNAVEI